MQKKLESYKARRSYTPEQCLTFKDKKLLQGLVYAHAKSKGKKVPALVRWICETYYRNGRKFPPGTGPPKFLKPVAVKRDRLTINFSPVPEVFERLINHKKEQRKTLAQKIKEILQLYYAEFLQRPLNIGQLKRLCIGGLTQRGELHKNWYIESILQYLIGVEEFRVLRKKHRWTPGISPGKR